MEASSSVRAAVGLLVAVLSSGCNVAGEAEDDVGALHSELARNSREVTHFGSNPGRLKMTVYLPQDLPPQPALVVAMHACGGSSSVFDEASGWVELAEKFRFALVLPSADGLLRCFNVHNPADQLRDQGDALSIKQMVDWMKMNHGIDSARVFATGFSSGGEMTGVLLGAYPDVFAAGGAVAGIPYLCASGSSPTALTHCTVGGGRDLKPAEWGALARQANPGKWTWPRMSIWHGSLDFVVHASNLTEQMEQWTNLNGIDQVADEVTDINGFPRRVYKNAAGEARVETVQLTGLGHLMPVYPGQGEVRCGHTSLRMASLNVGVCAAFHIARWFGLAP